MLDRHAQQLVAAWQVVAFTPFAGLLAWVENTLPLAQYLTGDRRGGAHARYRRPGDYSHPDCFSKMTRQPNSNNTPEKLRDSCVPSLANSSARGFNGIILCKAWLLPLGNCCGRLGSCSTIAPSGGRCTNWGGESQYSPPANVLLAPCVSATELEYMLMADYVQI